MKRRSFFLAPLVAAVPVPLVAGPASTLGAYRMTADGTNLDIAWNDESLEDLQAWARSRFEALGIVPRAA